MKYIDADKLKKIVEQAKQRALKGVEVDRDFYCDGRADAFEEVLLEIDSLQQEQPKLKPMNIPSGGGAMGTTPPKFKLEVKKQPVVKKSNALFDECVKNCDPAIMKEVSDNVDKMLGRQPVEGLEEEIDACWQNWLSPSNQKEVEGVLPKTEFAKYALHFAEWGKNNLK